MAKRQKERLVELEQIVNLAELLKETLKDLDPEKSELNDSAKAQLESWYITYEDSLKCLKFWIIKFKELTNYIGGTLFINSVCDRTIGIFEASIGICIALLDDPKKVSAKECDHIGSSTFGILDQFLRTAKYYFHD